MRRPPLAGLALLLALAGCAQPPAALREGPVRVAALSPNGLVLDADGASVAVTPPPGLCVDMDEVHLNPAAAVLLLERCSGETPGLKRMVSVAAAPLAPPGGAMAALEVMKARLEMADGWRDLGFGDAGETLRVAETAMEGEALMVVLQHDGDGPRGMGDRCRAITEINGRLTVATVAAPPDRPVAASLLAAETRALLAALRAANAAAAPPAARPAPPPAPQPAAPPSPPDRAPTRRPVA